MLPHHIAVLINLALSMYFALILCKNVTTLVSLITYWVKKEIVADITGSSITLEMEGHVKRIRLWDTLYHAVHLLCTAHFGKYSIASSHSMHTENVYNTILYINTYTHIWTRAQFLLF